jgi:hypothetical protein
MEDGWFGGSVAGMKWRGWTDGDFSTLWAHLLGFLFDISLTCIRQR